MYSFTFPDAGVDGAADSLRMSSLILSYRDRIAAMELPELQRTKVFVNGQPFAGKLEIKIATDPEVPLEDFIYSRFDRATTKITYRFFLLPDEGEPVEMAKGSCKFPMFGGKVEITTEDILSAL